MAGRFSRRVRAWAAANGIPLLDCKRGDKKHLLAHEYLPTDPTFVGVFLVLVSKAPARVWDAQRYGARGLNLVPTQPWPFVNHYSFHIMDPDWGHLTIKMSGHPPFGAQVILNGHEWVERQARKLGIDFVKEDNCFTGALSLADLDSVADTLNAEHSIGRLFQVCQRWIYSACLCFGLDLEEQERTNFRYCFSCYQMEYSRNLIFRRAAQLEEIYQGLIDRTRSHLDVPTLKTIYGKKYRPHRCGKTPAPRLETSLETPTYDLTVYKLHFGKLTLKMYDKGERVLRIEVIAHSAAELKCGKDIGNLVTMVASLRAILVRFLNVVRYADAPFLDDQVLDELSRPTHSGSRRLAGIDLNQARMRTVVDALLSLAPNPNGFTVGDLAQEVRELSGNSEEEYRDRQAAYDLKKIRGKCLVQRIDKTRRYHVDPEGFGTLAALLVIREKVLKPVLAGVHRRGGRPPKDPAPIDLHYRRLRRELSDTLRTLAIAA